MHKPRQNGSFTVPESGNFLDQLDIYRSAYEKLETPRKHDLRIQLLDLGKQVRCGTRTWVRQDLDDIAHWKGLPEPMLMIQKNSQDLEDRLAHTLSIVDETSRISALCEIRGMGPILASTLSMFTWPDSCGFLDHHTSNALRFLGYEFPKKHYTSRFTVSQLLTYLRTIRSLADSKIVSPMEIAEALCALDHMRMRNNWLDSTGIIGSSPTMIEAKDF